MSLCDITSTEYELVDKTNHLLDKVQIEYQVQYLGDITPSVFVILYERLLGQQLKDVIREPRGREEETHNCQTVIDSLSMDVLDISLSHISGEEVVRLNRRSLDNLLEVFSGLSVYILGAIDSASDTEGSYDNESMPARYINGTSNIGERSPQLVPEREVVQPPDRVMPVWETMHDGPIMEQRLHSGSRMLGNKIEPLKIDCVIGSLKDITVGSKSAHHLDKQHPQAIDEKSVSLVTPDLPDKEGAQFDYIGMRPREQPPRSANIHTQQGTRDMHHGTGDTQQDTQQGGGKGAQRTFTHHLFHHTVPPEVTATKLDCSKPKPTVTTGSAPSTSTHSVSRDQQNSSIPPASCLTRKVTAPPPADNLIPPSTSSTKQSIGQVTASTSFSPDTQQSNNSQHQSNSEIDLREYSPTLRRTIQSLQTQSALINKLSKSPRKPGPRLKQQNVFDRLYENPITSSLSKDSGVGDKRIVDLRDPGNNRSQPLRHTLPMNRRGAENHPKRPSKDVYARHTRHYSSDPEVNEGGAQERPSNTQTKTECKKRVQFKSPGETQVYAKSSVAAKKKLQRSLQYLCNVYEDDLQNLKDDLFEDLDIDHKSAEKIDSQFKNVFLGGKRNRNASNSLAKTKVHPTPGLVKPRKERKRSRSASPTVGRRIKTSVDEKDDKDDLVTALLEEFPYLYISGETWHELWRKGIRQIDQVTRKQDQSRRRQCRSHTLLEEADRKQDILHKIIKKQLAHTQRLRECKAQKSNDVAIRNRLRDKRVEIARARRYYEEYQTRMRAKMLKRRTREEMVFKKLFEDGLAVQKERVQDMYDYAKEQKEAHNHKQKDQLASIENYYRDQFELLSATVAHERQDLLIREKAQQKVVEQMERQLRVKMEREIQEIQDQLLRDDDDVYFRELDAERIRDVIKSAPLTALR